jgi:hypothetical protein
MRDFANKFRVDMMEHVVSSIKFAIDNKLSLVEVFQFKNSPFVITINESEFDINLSHIGKYYKEHEMYELIPRIEQLRKNLNKKTDEKENSEDSDGPNPII